MSAAIVYRQAAQAGAIDPAAANCFLCPEAAFDVVAIVASKGGFKALRSILAALPPEFPAAILIQMHLSPRLPSLLVDLLRPHTLLPVTWATDGAVLQPGMVTVVPPGRQVRVSPAGRLTVDPNHSTTRFCCDDLLLSVARSFGARALGVVLTGYLNDGAKGAQAIHHHGGQVLVQDPCTAEAAAMPRAALQTGCADLVLPLHVIPASLTALVMVRGIAQLFTVSPAAASTQPYRVALRCWGIEGITNHSLSDEQRKIPSPSWRGLG